MTHKQRMETVLNLGTPDYVPTTELEFQLEEELLGKRFLREKDLEGLSTQEVDRKIAENAEYMLLVYEKLDYDAFGVHYLSEKHQKETIARIREFSGDEYMVFAHGDGTFAIPDGAGMEAFAYRLADEPEVVHEEAERMCQEAIQHNRRMFDAGFDAFILCSDYCFNRGPFLSPRLFREFVTPYLARIIEDLRRIGAYAIKHTDGDIMPILDQLIEANPHALHSLDPMAGVDIAKVKQLTLSKLALMGNVNCALMQTGTEREVVESAEYCLTHGKPGGGYVFCTSNVPFKGLPYERYQLVLDTWKRLRDY